MPSKLITAPLSVLYSLVVGIRHKLFDLKILKSEEFDIPVVCVGNLTVGGTGKTPVTEYLIENLSGNYNVAVLSRGYKRKTKGFILAETTSSYRTIGDEPKQIKLKYPEIPVAVCEKRVEGIQKLREMHPEVNLIILDDAFQHRYVEPWVNIILMDYNNPIYRDQMLPSGTLRDLRSQLYRANQIIVTKCPDHMNPLDMRIVRNSLELYPYQSLYFTHMQQGAIVALFPDKALKKQVQAGDNILLMAGIANTASLQSSMKKYNIVDTLFFDDHHAYRMRDLELLKQKLADNPADTVIVTTEKDAVKLTNRNKIPTEIQARLYYIPIHVSFVGDSEGEFLRQLDQYARTNQKYSILHPE